MKPQLAQDLDFTTLVYPVYVQSKIDGVRAMNLNGTLTGRSLDPFKGFGVTEYFSKPEFIGMDGEMTLGDNPASNEGLCRTTTGALGRFKGVTEMPDLHWWVFDAPNLSLPYSERYAALADAVKLMNHPRLHLVPYEIANNEEELKAIIAKHIEAGYEGTIVRNPKALGKGGRPTKPTAKNPNGGNELMRVKPWMDSEMLVTSFDEGSTNTNEAKTNSLGRTERSSAKDGLVPNGMVGTINGTLIEDIYHPFNGNLLFRKGLKISIGPGEMTDAEAALYFKNPDLLLKHIVKFKHLAHDPKDLPRMGTYVSHRLAEDMS